MITLMLALVIGQVDDSDAIRARIAIEVAILNSKAQPPIPVRPAPPRPIKPAAEELNYTEARTKAIDELKPFVVFVGCQARPIAGTVHCRVESLHSDSDEPHIAISSPISGKLAWIGELSPNSSDAEIRGAFNQWRESVSPVKKMPMVLVSQGSGLLQAPQARGEAQPRSFGRSPAFSSRGESC